MKKLLLSLMLIGLMAALGGCSMSQTTSDDEVPPEEVPVDAATDAVPADSAEVPAAEAPTDETASETAALDAPPAEAPPAETPVAEAPPIPQAEAPVTPPAPEAPVAEAAPATGSFDDYTVQSGDTLMKIAFETYGDLYKWKTIYEANKDKLASSNAIPVGTVLRIEKPAVPVTIERNGEKYLIKSGDTLGTISQDVYGTKTKWKKLWENNRQLIQDPNKIFAGFYLFYVPETEKQMAPAPIADSSAAQPADAESDNAGREPTSATGAAQ